MRKIGIIFSLCLLICCGYLVDKKVSVSIQALKNQKLIEVSIEGAVEKEGTYTFDSICTVGKALEQAGVLDNADIKATKPERIITHQLRIYVPYDDDTLISLNEATIEQLTQIPGIGPAKAEAIIEARPFLCIEDLMKVKGIGEKSYLKYRTYVRL